jgi:hypothetical protein
MRSYEELEELEEGGGGVIASAAIRAMYFPLSQGIRTFAKTV